MGDTKCEYKFLDMQNISEESRKFRYEMIPRSLYECKDGSWWWDYEVEFTEDSEKTIKRYFRNYRKEISEEDVLQIIDDIKKTHARDRLK